MSGNDKRKILILIGTRPEAIKMASVIQILHERADLFDTKICLTGQHREMLDNVIKHFDFFSDYDLGVMRKGQSLSRLTSEILSKFQGVLQEFRPHILLVQGDTTSAFIGALAGFYNRVKVGHIEAGLRTHDKHAPFPEEMNRKLTGSLADYHFAPTQRARSELLSEGVEGSNILVTGNTVIDALFITLSKIQGVPSELVDLDFIKLPQKMVLITGHRRENFGEGFINICEAIRILANRYSDYNFVYPVHLNPNVQKPVFDILGNLENVYLLKPMGYISFIYLMNMAHIILTDSGGIQEEAPSLGKPVLVMREVTERPEAVEAGTAILVGTDKSKIVDAAMNLIEDHAAWKEMSKKNNPYGDGKAAYRIVNFLKMLYIKSEIE